MFRQEREPQLIRGLYRVDLDGETLAQIEQDGLPIYYYGDRARAAKNEPGLRGSVGVYREGVLERSYGEPWHIQLEMIAEENAKVQRQDPSWRIVVPHNPATAIAVTKNAYEQYGINVLPLWTRVGEDGSLIAGGFSPRGGAFVNGDWRPHGRHGVVGVLPLAVHA